MTIQRFTRDVEPETLAAALAADGCAVVERLVDADVLDRLAAEIGPFVEDTPGGPDDFAGHQTRRVGALLARSPASHELVLHPTVRGTVDLVLAHATSYHLHLTQIIAIGPDETAQPIHRDQWAFDFFPFPPGYEVQCNTLWALTDFTEENGATHVRPGSNHATDVNPANPSDEDRATLAAYPEERATMPKGSVLLYTGALYHGGGANHSDAVRVGVNITYAVSWLRQEENQYLTTPLDVAATFPEDLQRLMGYARGAYALGYVDDIRDPIEVLRPGAGRAGFGDTPVDA